MLGKSRVSSRERRTELVRVGAMFRRVHDDHLVETARVLSVSEGPLGIPHVRFSVFFERGRFPVFEDGPRILSLSSFTEFYHDPVEN